MKFYVNYFGCRANQAEIQDWIIDLENSGYRLTDDIDDADFAILNTCSVTEKAEKDVFRYINKVYKKSNIRWLIAGCTTTKEQETLENKYKNYIFLDNVKKKGIVSIVKETFPIDENVIFHSSFRSRIFMKIQDGCSFKCSFCIVPLLRGKPSSLPIEDVVRKASYYSSLGYREVILTGINLSSYGYDLFPRVNILDLVKELNKIKDIEIIRLSSLDPRYIKYGFIKELSYLDKIAESFHFSFQSGSNTVLKRMKRNSNVKDYRKILDTFLTFFPDANYGADIILGFPGETDKEYLETFNFIKKSELNYIHTFPYSSRGGTKAAELEPVPGLLIKKRVREFRDMNKEKKIRYREKFRGRKIEGILIEEKDNYSLIMTKNYLTVKVPPLKGYKKKKLTVEVTKIINDNICEGKVVEK
ncbi:MAG: MiaB/RimO family radical SAM methylthiotransferase [Acidobacteriota bacterium]